MTPHRWNRGRTLAVAVLVLVASSTLISGSVQAQVADGPGPLGGYDGQAHSSGLHVFYNPSGLLPTAAPVDAGSPDALATISSGPATFGRASVADPGDLLVNPDALLTQADPDYPEGTFPEYPFRISATSTFGEPVAESRPAPGFHARVEATDDGSTARASTPAFEAPAIVTAGSMASFSSTEFDGSTVTVHARNEVSAFDLLGVLTIDSIVTEVVASSSGGAPELEGGTTVSGASFMGQPVTIDSEGIHLEEDAEEGEDESDVPLLGAVKDALPSDLTGMLADAGIRVSLPGPVEHSGETTGQLGSTGLRIDLEVSERTAPILGQIADALPPLDSPIPGAPSVEDVVAAARARHLVALDVGRAVVSLTTSPAFEAPPFEAPSTDLAAGATALPGSPSAPATTASGSAAAPAPASAPAAVTPGPASSSDTSVGSLGAGIGALALLALLLQPFIGDRIARASAAILATSPADTCPLEQP